MTQNLQEYDIFLRVKYYSPGAAVKRRLGKVQTLKYYDNESEKNLGIRTLPENPPLQEKVILQDPATKLRQKFKNLSNRH